jgi:hypothetical protein
MNGYMIIAAAVPLMVLLLSQAYRGRCSCPLQHAPAAQTGVVPFFWDFFLPGSGIRQLAARVGN